MLRMDAKNMRCGRAAFGNGLALLFVITATASCVLFAQSSGAEERCLETKSPSEVTEADIDERMKEISMIQKALEEKAKTKAREMGKRYIYPYDGEIWCGRTHVPFRSFGWDFAYACGVQETVSNDFGSLVFRALDDTERKREECTLQCPWPPPWPTSEGEKCRPYPYVPLIAE